MFYLILRYGFHLCLFTDSATKSAAGLKDHLKSVLFSTFGMLSSLVSSAPRCLLRPAPPCAGVSLRVSRARPLKVSSAARSSSLAIPSLCVRLYSSQYIEPSKKKKRSIGADNRPVLALPVGVERPSVEGSSSSQNWTDLGLDSPSLLAAIEELGFPRPTLIQQLVIPTLTRDGTRHVVFADQTGTGKTLAYLLPLLQSLKRDEQLHGRIDQPGRPRAIVLVPNRELAEQVLRVAKKLSHVVKLRAVCFSGGSTVSDQRKHFNSPIDIIIATPGRLLQHYERKRIFFSKVKLVVMDEVDMLLDNTDGGFAKECYKVVDAVKHRIEATQQDAQFIMCGATITQVLLNEIASSFPNVEHIISPTLHKSVAKLKQQWILVSADKLSKLKEVLFKEYPRESHRQASQTTTTRLAAQKEALEGKEEVMNEKRRSSPKSLASPSKTVSSPKRTIIFCNTINSCRFLDHTLTELGFSTACYHGDIPVDQRPLNFARFAEGVSPILVCTDVASRGLDFVSLDHVILFDFPLNSIDYLHRIGRTARAGKSGKVTNFIMRRDLVLADAIRAALQKGESLEGLTASAAENRQMLNTQEPSL